MLLGINVFNKLVLFISLVLIIPSYVTVGRVVLTKKMILSATAGLMIGGLWVYWLLQRKNPYKSKWVLVGDVLVIMVGVIILLMIGR